MSNGNIPEHVIEAVLKHHDIVETVGKVVHLTKAGKYYKGLCPFHSEKTPSFTVTPEKQIYHCYGCGNGGNAIKFVMETEELSFPEAIRSMAEEAGIPFHWDGASAEQTAQQKERSELIRAHELSATFYHYLLKNTEQGKPALNYLRDRGFTDKLIDAFQIGYAPAMWDRLTLFLEKREFDLAHMEKGGLISRKGDATGYVDRFRNRVMFPIRNDKGAVIAFSGRVLSDEQPKYLNSPETPLFRKSRSLYNFHQARTAIRKTGQVVLFEGYADVIKAWDAGVHQGVATMGTALTEEHCALLKRNTENVILCYDGDDAGQNATYKSLTLLEKAGCNVQVACLPPRMDPDEYITVHGPQAFMTDIMAAVVPVTKFRLLYLKRDHPIHDEEGKRRYIQAALHIVAELASPIEREQYVQELSGDYGYSPDLLKQELYQIREGLQKRRLGEDNNDKPWNNVINDRRTVSRSPALFPAYHTAERKLLAAMIHDADTARYVEAQLGDQFNVEAHAALAAFLYAYYAEDRDPDPSRFIATLRDTRLESVASAISMSESSLGINPRVIDDYISEIKKYPQQLAIERKKEDMVRAERSGDVLTAVQIGNEIITLEKQLKSL